MTDEQFRSRTRELLDEECVTPRRWFWLSFADDSLPQGQQFLGAIIIEAFGTATATIFSHALRLNPGGEVLCTEIPNDKLHLFPHEARYRLLSREEAEQM